MASREGFVSRDRSVTGAFTLIELLVATAVLALILVLFLKIISVTTSVTKRAGDTISSFQDVRAALDILTTNISQATINAYWGYDDPNTPTKYQRESGLHFLITRAGGSYPGTAGTGHAIFYQAPLGTVSGLATHGELNNLINACGYYIEYGNDAGPFGLQSDYGYRLMQAVEPAESLKVYLASSQTSGLDWVANLSSFAVPIAKNIIYLAAWPRRPPAEDPAGTALTADFTYNSRTDNTSNPQPETANQLPPTVQIMLVALDEASARKMKSGSTPPTEVSGVFTGLFSSSSATSFKSDLKTMQERLAAQKLNARIFTTIVPIRESKMQ